MTTINVTPGSKRIRINISTSVRGIYTYDCTVEMPDASVEEVLAESDRLVAALDQRYSREKDRVSNTAS